MLSQQVMIVNKLGLHARASSQLVGLANTFVSSIHIIKDQKSANAKSLMSVMMLAATCGSTVTLTIDGNDELLAMHKLLELINNKFGEAE